MAWVVKIDGHEVDSDDFLLDDLAWIEKRTGSFWSLLNPWKNAEQAKAFIRVALVRSGVSEEDADARCESLTLRDIKGAFDFREDTATPARAEGKGSGPTAPTSPSSSPGARGSSGGRRKKQDGSD